MVAHPTFDAVDSMIVIVERLPSADFFVLSASLPFLEGCTLPLLMS